MAVDKAPGAIVGYDEVAGVIEEMQKEGIRDPGILRIRNALGRGSTGRITKLKARYMANQAAKMPVSPTRADNPLAAAADALWLQMMEALEAQEREMVQQLEGPLREAHAELAALQEEKEKALDLIKQLREEGDATGIAISELEEKVDALRAAVATAEKQAQEELHQRLLTEERLRSALDRLEIERKSTAALQDDHVQQVDRLRDDARRLEDRLHEALRREKELQVREQALKAQNTELLAARERLQGESKALQSAAAQAEQLASERHGQLASLSDERQRLWDRLAELEDQRVLDQKNLAALERQLERQAQLQDPE